MGCPPETEEAAEALLYDPTQAPDVYIFADESEYGVTDKPGRADSSAPHIYAVGAVVVEGQSVLETMNDKLADLRDEASRDPAIRNHPEKHRLRESGWHLTQDQISTAVSLWQFISQSVGIKIHYRYFRSRAKIDGTKLAPAYAVLHAALARDLLRRYDHSSTLEYNFEEYQGLNSRFEHLVEWCLHSLDDYMGVLPSVKTLSKGDSDILSIADYSILGTSRLIGANDLECPAARCAGACRRTLLEPDAVTRGHLTSKSMHYRNFEYFQKSLSSALEIRLHPGVLGLTEPLDTPGARGPAGV